MCEGSEGLSANQIRGCQVRLRASGASCSLPDAEEVQLEPGNFTVSPGPNA